MQGGADPDDNFVIIRGSVQLLYDKESDALRMGKQRKNSTMTGKFKMMGGSSVFDDDETIDSNKFMILDTFHPGEMEWFAFIAFDGAILLVINTNRIRLNSFFCNMFRTTDGASEFFDGAARAWGVCKVHVAGARIETR